MKIQPKFLKPCNPLLAAARFRRAGALRRNAVSEPHQARCDLQRELDRMKPPYR
jgi:hypothetical protein